MGRWLLAGLVGGVLLFVWGFVSHVLPLAGTGLLQMPRSAEGPIGAALKANLPEKGLYFYPGLEGGLDASEEAQAEWTERYLAGPTGVLLYKPAGEGDPMDPMKMLREALFDILCGLAAAFVLMHVPVSVGYGRRVLLVAAIALFGSLNIDASWWIWYGFPTNWFQAQLVVNLVAGIVAGLAIAAIAKPRALA